MVLFDIFKRRSASVSSPNEVVTTSITNENQVTSTAPVSNSGKIISITYGTGMPIDVIYAFLNEDYEQAGYEDALVNSNAEYCKTKETILIHKLEQLFKRIQLRYRGDIVDLDNRIANAKTLFALQTVTKLEARKKICEEHIAEINDMMQKLKAESPEMMTMIESYRRGFVKGFAAKNANFFTANQISEEQL